VGAGGYLWWYIDAISDDGRSGLTLIAFVGSVFSPYYAWSGRRDPLDHCAVNVALYGEAGRGWAMTERGRDQVRRDANHLAVGPSSLTWGEDGLTAAFDEVTAPRRSRLRGTIRLSRSAVNRQAYAIDAAGRHVWRPILPRTSVEVRLSDQTAGWRGTGYFDTNAGDEPLENAFQGWNWSRAHLPSGTLIHYDVVRRDGEAASLALRFDGDQPGLLVEAPPPIGLPRTGWRIGRQLRADAADDPASQRRLEDTPFYARSSLRARHDGVWADVIHESLSLDRLRNPIVKAMLPFRMPRIFW
jgi:carotenoid 1,2-hydratase